MKRIGEALPRKGKERRSKGEAWSSNEQPCKGYAGKCNGVDWLGIVTSCKGKATQRNEMRRIGKATQRNAKKGEVNECITNKRDKTDRLLDRQTKPATEGEQDYMLMLWGGKEISLQKAVLW